VKRRPSAPAVHLPGPIEMIDTAALVPYARNARTHSPAQVAQIAASIREFGFTNPVLVDAAGTIIAGHGPALAAQQLQLAQVPCIRLAHLTETQRRAYVLADNQIALQSGWDADLLADELAALADADFDITLAGFEPAAVATAEAESAVTAEALQRAELQAANPAQPLPSDEDAAHAELAQDDRPAQLPIVPQYGEHHEAFIIVCDNAIDEAWLRAKLGLDELHRSYKDVKALRPNVLTVQQFRERLG